MTSPRRELSEFERGAIFGCNLAGWSQSEIARHFGFPRTTVQTVLLNPILDRNARTGRLSSFSVRDERSILREIRKNPKISYQNLNQILPEPVSQATLYRMLKRHGISNWVAKKRPFLTEEMATNRLTFTLKYKDWTYDEWKNII
jgi:hypothetical protein